MTRWAEASGQRWQGWGGFLSEAHVAGLSSVPFCEQGIRIPPPPPPCPIVTSVTRPRQILSHPGFPMTATSRGVLQVSKQKVIFVAFWALLPERRLKRVARTFQSTSTPRSSGAWCGGWRGLRHHWPRGQFIRLLELACSFLLKCHVSLKNNTAVQYPTSSGTQSPSLEILGMVKL